MQTDGQKDGQKEGDGQSDVFLLPRVETIFSTDIFPFLRVSIPQKLIVRNEDAR
jgi:hypothetical protein